jgi:hypothetical protein
MLRIFLTERIHQIFSPILLFLHLDGGFLKFLSKLEELIANTLAMLSIARNLGNCGYTWES